MARRAAAARLVRGSGPRRTLDEETLAPESDLADLTLPGRVLWLDVRGVGDAAFLERLDAAFSLHRLVVADIANTGRRPKLEDHDGSLFLVLRMVTTTTEQVEWEQVSLVQRPDHVHTIQETGRSTTVTGWRRSRTAS